MRSLVFLNVAKGNSRYAEAVGSLYVDLESQHISDITRIYHKYKWHSHVKALAVVKICLVLEKITFQNRHVFLAHPVSAECSRPPMRALELE